MAFIGFCAVALVGLVFSHLYNSADNVKKVLSFEEKRAWQIANSSQLRVNDILDDMIFVKHDTVNNLCFACFWRGRYDGGPAAFKVPCDEIPEKLLYTRKDLKPPF